MLTNLRSTAPAAGMLISITASLMHRVIILIVLLVGKEWVRCWVERSWRMGVIFWLELSGGNVASIAI